MTPPAVHPDESPPLNSHNFERMTKFIKGY